MRILVTGASGWIGSAVVPELLRNGHHVLGLARSDSSARTVEQAGAEVRRGDLTDPAGLREAAEGADAVVHLAFRHDLAFTGDMAGAAQADQAAIDAFGEALREAGGVLLAASGTAVVQRGRAVTESDRSDPAHPRGASEARVLGLAERGVRSAVIRFAPSVHGTGGDPGFLAVLARGSREHGEVPVVGDGTNRWPAVHRSDVARLVARAVVDVPTGTVLHAVAEQGVPTADLTEALGRRLDLPVASIDAETITQRLGFIGTLLALDLPASSTRTQELLDWQPVSPTLVEDVEAGGYDVPALIVG